SGSGLGFNASHNTSPAAGSGGSPLGFDMSKFRKPGEWKCQACYVKNGPENDKCLSCEASKPGAEESGGGGSGTNSFPSNSFPSSGFISSAGFSFGGPNSSEGEGGPRFGVRTCTPAAAPAPAPAPAPAGGSAVPMGFDMSKFRKPGEWKCQACLVKNGLETSKCLSCETPKSGSTSGVA
ncbi:unnamed protein product, partial [Choristocarpus tenellus]